MCFKYVFVFAGWSVKTKNFLIHGRYKTPDRKKMFGKVLDQLHDKYMLERRDFLQNKNSGLGRAGVTGDGATIMGTKFLNFLVHEHGKGVMLCKIKDCTGRLKEVGTIEAQWACT